MADSHFNRRHRKRISLRFGIDKAEKFGFTDDLNHEGLFIRSAVTVKPGGTIIVAIELPPGIISLTGEVKWAKRVPSNVIHKLKGGMGVRITSFQAGKEIYHALCDELILQRGE